jgi:tetratricopeptide (TPR) repeat protein
MMGRVWIVGLATFLLAGEGSAQSDNRAPETGPSNNRLVLGGGNESLSAGAAAIRVGSYEKGIRLTTRGLERESPQSADRSAALSNLCAAYAATGDPDAAIDFCNQSLALNSGNWRAFSNRAYAYWLKGMYIEARYDVDAAAAISPSARQVVALRGMINEAVLQPRVTTEDHQ